MNQLSTILLVEDNPDDVLLMQKAILTAAIQNPLQIVNDGDAAVAYLSGEGIYADRKAYPLPTIVLLDLQLPYRSGHSVLEWIRQQPQFETMVVIVLTSSSIPQDLRKSYALGANSYIVKPPTATQLVELAKAFRWYWLEFNQCGPVDAR